MQLGLVAKPHLGRRRHALKGHKTHVVTGSGVLSARIAEANHQLQISVSCRGLQHH